MTSTDTAEKSIVIRAAQRRRYTDTNGRTTRRIIRFNGPIQSSHLAWAKAGDEITLWCEEATQTQAIGSLQATANEEHGFAPVYLTLPPAAFAEFWAAASDADSALRNITIKFEDAMMEYAITNVVLLEGTLTHPVVAELRFMQRWLRVSLIGLLVAAVVFVGLEILKVAWVFWYAR